MTGLVSVVLFVLGLAMIIKGSDWFIDAVIWVATVFKIPYILIGATIVSICTTLPETFVSVTAAIGGETDYAFGNAIGSIAANTGFIMAILLLFAKPIIDDRKDFTKNGFFLIFLLIAMLIVGSIYGEVGRIAGIILLVFLVLYLANNVLSARKKSDLTQHYELEDEKDMTGEPVLYEGVALDQKEHEIDISKKTVRKYVIMFFVGIALVIFGSNLLVENGIKIAELLGVPSLLIAITFTSIGTSLPELVTTITSIRKKVGNLGVGNIIGADILNIIQVVAASSLITPIPLAHDPAILKMQIPLTLILVAFAVCFGTFSKKGFRKWQGVVLLLVYVIFLMLNILREGMPVLGSLFFG